MSEMSNLRRLRKARGLVLMALAVRAGVSIATLHAADRHGYIPSDPTRRRIANALGVKLEDLWPELEAEVEEVERPI